MRSGGNSSYKCPGAVKTLQDLQKRPETLKTSIFKIKKKSKLNFPYVPFGNIGSPTLRWLIIVGGLITSRGVVLVVAFVVLVLVLVVPGVVLVVIEVVASHYCY